MKDIKQNTEELEIEGVAVLVFTIAARNYLGQVSVLFDSVRKQCGDINFCCFVVDGYDDNAEIPEVLRNNVFDCRKLGISSFDFEEMACKYSVVEFSTALKPFIFNYIFEFQKSDSAIYLDPDIKLYTDTNWIEAELKSKSILLTPHLLDFKPYRINYTGIAPVFPLSVFLNAGTYNLGFVAIKNDSYGRDFIDLWAAILRDQCFDDSTRSLCVDQKWADFLSSFFVGRVGVLKDAGANVAYWNLHERNLIRDAKSNYVVNGSQLKFVHFSGIDLTDKDGISAAARYQNISLMSYPEYRELFTTYKDELIKAGFKERMANIAYRYNYFENGLPISKLHRKIYVKLISKGDVASPFSVHGKFYRFLEAQNVLESELKPENNKAQSYSVFKDVAAKLVSPFRYVLKLFFRLLYRLLGHRKYLLLARKLRDIAELETNKHI